MRAEKSLIQTIGRAARNANGKVILYADTMTGSMKGAIDETNRRRKIQIAYNKKHNITPQTIIKEISDISETIMQSKIKEVKEIKRFVPKDEIQLLIDSLKNEMEIAATALEFEKAAELRDKIAELES